jgi:hypothetical protein
LLGQDYLPAAGLRQGPLYMTDFYCEQDVEIAGKKRCAKQCSACESLEVVAQAEDEEMYEADRTDYDLHNLQAQ